MRKQENCRFILFLIIFCNKHVLPIEVKILTLSAPYLTYEDMHKDYFLLANSLAFKTSVIIVTHTPGKTEEIVIIWSLHLVVRLQYICLKMTDYYLWILHTSNHCLLNIFRYHNHDRKTIFLLVPSSINCIYPLYNQQIQQMRL